MPIMDGVELCQKLRAAPPSRHIPIIAASALPQLPAALDGLVDAFLRKPLDFDRLRATIEAHLLRQ
jgi:CheY-like chemotaxis protein